MRVNKYLFACFNLSGRSDTSALSDSILSTIIFFPLRIQIVEKINKYYFIQNKENDEHLWQIFSLKK